MIGFRVETEVMPDISAIASALSSLKAAKDIAEAMISLRDTATFQAKLIEFQGKLIDANNAAFAAQDERTALLERIRDLEKQVTDLKAWDTEKQCYELKSPIVRRPPPQAVMCVRAHECRHSRSDGQ